MINDMPAVSSDPADTANPPLITAVNRSRQRRHRPTVVDDAPWDWEWEDWAGRFWASEPHALCDGDACTCGSLDRQSGAVLDRRVPYGCGRGGPGGFGLVVCVALVLRGADAVTANARLETSSSALWPDHGRQTTTLRRRVTRISEASSSPPATAVAIPTTMTAKH